MLADPPKMITSYKNNNKTNKQTTIKQQPHTTTKNIQKHIQEIHTDTYTIFTCIQKHISLPVWCI